MTILSDNNMTLPFVSVIIPVFNDSERLKICLQALEAQTYPKHLFEVIVVDNASKNSLESVVTQFSKAKYVYEGQQGSYAARNKGISVAKGEIIAFTDSDCIPASDWVENGVAALLRDSKCGIVGGQIKLFFKDPQKLTIVELYESLTAFPQKRHIKKHHFTPTANLITFKSLFDEVGNFNQNLKSNGDREWCQLVNQHGYRINYDEKTIVEHPARSSFKQLYRRYLRMAGGRADAYRDKYSNNLFVFKILQEVFGNFLLIPKDILVVFSKFQYSAAERVKILLVLLALKWALNSEKMRVMMGGTSKNY